MNVIKFDFKTYTKNLLDSNVYKELFSKKQEVMDKFNSSNMIGWTRQIDKSLVNEIKDTAAFIKKNFDCLVVIGIGGSFLGSYSFDKMFRRYFDDKGYEVIYAGTTLSSKYLDELLIYLRKKNLKRQ